LVGRTTPTCNVVGAAVGAAVGAVVGAAVGALVGAIVGVAQAESITAAIMSTEAILKNIFLDIVFSP
jgi:outer membrane lipoprotein SlyB